MHTTPFTTPGYGAVPAAVSAPVLPSSSRPTPSFPARASGGTSLDRQEVLMGSMRARATRPVRRGRRAARGRYCRSYLKSLSIQGLKKLADQEIKMHSRPYNEGNPPVSIKHTQILDELSKRPQEEKYIPEPGPFQEQYNAEQQAAKALLALNQK